MVRTLRRGAVAGTVLVAGQIAHAALRNLPYLEGLDPSVAVGDNALPRLRMLIVGDSTVTAPGLADPDESWPRLVAHHLTTRYNVELTSLAVGGARSQDVLEKQVPEAKMSRWDITIVSVGSNDVLHLVPIWRYARRLDRIAEQLEMCSKAVILFGVGDLGSIPRLPFPVDRIASMAGRIADWGHRRTAERHRLPKVDQWRLTTAAFNSGVHMFAPDLFHPSAMGHRAWADALIPTVEEAIANIELDMRGRTHPAEEVP